MAPFKKGTVLFPSHDKQKSLHSTYSDLKCHTMHVVESNQLLYCLVGKKGPSTTPFPLTIAKLQSPIYIWRHLKGIQPILKLHDLRDWNRRRRRRRISNCKLLFTSTTSWPVVYQAALPLCTKSKKSIFLCGKQYPFTRSIQESVSLHSVHRLHNIPAALQSVRFEIFVCILKNIFTLELDIIDPPKVPPFWSRSLFSLVLALS